jgi:predicted nicotinamide N-methyase
VHAATPCPSQVRCAAAGVWWAGTAASTQRQTDRPTIAPSLPSTRSLRLAPGFTGEPMSEIQTRSLTFNVGEQPYRLRVLNERYQFTGHDGQARRLGISPARWSEFGHVWPTTLLLAQAMLRVDIDRRRVLELGCGIALATLVLQRRGADVVASDTHPLAEPFLVYNAALNALPRPRFARVRWDAPPTGLGRFDLIVASDVLYEPAQVQQLADLVAHHAADRAEIVFTDPGEQNSARFSRLLAEQGFDATIARCPMNDADQDPHRGRLLVHRRGMARA